MSQPLDIESVAKQLGGEIETLLSMKAGTIGPDTDLTVLGIDSLRFVSLLLVIEQKFGVNLMEAGLTNDDTRSTRCLSAAILRGRAA